MISFLSAEGVGGRNGLEPASAWYQVVKWEALVGEAGREGARARLGLLLGLAGVEHEGDGSRQAEGGLRLALGADPAPLQRAADARHGLQPLAHRGADRAVTRHRLPRRGLRRASAPARSGSLQALTGDRNAALSALFERLVESTEQPVPQKAVLAAEREVILESFHGSRSAYLAALTPVARDARARARDPRRRDPARAARAAAVRAAAHGSRGVRVLLRLSGPARPAGSRLADAALAREGDGVRARRGGSAARLLGADGEEVPDRDAARDVHRRPLAAAQPLGALPLSAARPSIVATLRGFERAQSFENWTIDAAGSRAEPDDLPPRSAAAAGRDRPHRVPAVPPDPVGEA